MMKPIDYVAKVYNSLIKAKQEKNAFSDHYNEGEAIREAAEILNEYGQPTEFVSVSLHANQECGSVHLNIHFNQNQPALVRLRILQLLQKGLVEEQINTLVQAEVEDPDDYLDPPPGQINHPEDPGREPE